MGTRFHKLSTMSKCQLTLSVSIDINIQDLDGITQQDIERHINYCLIRQEANHPPFEIQMFNHGLHQIIDDAIRCAIEENHEKRYPGTVPYVTENCTGETAKWCITSKKVIRRISHYCTNVWRAKLWNQKTDIEPEDII